jgi:acetyl esterase/lipase
MRLCLFLLCLFLTTCAAAEPADSHDPLAAVIEVSRKYQVLPNNTYRVVQGRELKLDVFRPRKDGPLLPVMVYIHGGGWVSHDKERATLHTLPFLARDHVVFNIDYRVGKGTAPAGVEDCFCALKWIRAHAAEFRADGASVVVMGHSAGGHLALMMGVGKDNSACPEPLPVVRAVVNWFGISDVRDVYEGANSQQYAREWLEGKPDPRALADSVSPIRLVRADNPPIISIHGDHDPAVPYPQSVRLHEALSKAHVKNQLITIKGGTHGGFPEPEYLRAYRAVFAFIGIP